MATKKRQATQALDFLDDIIEDTEEQARLEEERLAEARRQREEEQRRKEEDERRRRQEEADRRIAEEEQRRREAAERRSMAERAMKDVDEPEEKVVAAPAPVVQQPEEKTSILIPLLAALVIGALAVGGFFAYQEVTRDYVDNETAYTIIEPTIDSLNADEAQHQVAVLLKPEEEAKIEAAAPARRSSSSKKPSSSAPPAPSGLKLGGGISGRQ